MRSDNKCALCQVSGRYMEDHSVFVERCVITFFVKCHNTVLMVTDAVVDGHSTTINIRDAVVQSHDVDCRDTAVDDHVLFRAALFATLVNYAPFRFLLYLLH